MLTSLDKMYRGFADLWHLNKLCRRMWWPMWGVCKLNSDSRPIYCRQRGIIMPWARRFRVYSSVCSKTEISSCYSMIFYAEIGRKMRSKVTQPALGLAQRCYSLEFLLT